MQRYAPDAVLGVGNAKVIGSSSCRGAHRSPKGGGDNKRTFTHLLVLRQGQNFHKLQILVFR